MNEQRIAPDTIHNAPSDYQGDGSSRAVINDRTGLYIAVIAIVMSGISLGISLMQPAVTNAKVENLQDRVVTAEREARVMQERWNDLKVELAKRGISVSDH